MSQLSPTLRPLLFHHGSGRKLFPVPPPRSNSYRPQTVLTVRAFSGSPHRAADPVVAPRWEKIIATAASLYPLYITIGGAVACYNPSAFSWFVQRRPASYTFSLGLIMLVMGLSLELRDLLALFRQRPLSILFGCVAQYTIMPAFGAIFSKALGLPPSLSVTLIAQGDVALSIVMTICTTLSAVVLTPLLTKFLAGAYVPVDAAQLSISTLQLVVAPVLLGSYLQSAFPALVKLIIPFAPLIAVLTSSLLSSSVFSENVVRFKTSAIGASSSADFSTPLGSIPGFPFGDIGVVVLSVVLLHFAGFLLGYLSATICGLRERERRAITIEVGMQNCSLGVVLATAHFTSPLVAFPPALSAIIMNIMGSTLGFVWRYMDPTDDKK